MSEWDSCVGCHGAHDTSLDVSDCTTCHGGATELRDIRATPPDIDGDGDTAEGMGRSIANLHERLGEAIRRFAAEVAGRPIVYDSAAYPFFFGDLDGDGEGSGNELVRENAYASWTPCLLRAAYNYRFVSKDRGAYAHNPHYAAQLLIDSLEDLRQAVEVGTEGLERP